jgi:hypothetical protein
MHLSSGYFFFSAAALVLLPQTPSYYGHDFEQLEIPLAPTLKKLADS